MRKILTIIILILLIIPFSCQAFFLDDWFEDLFEEDEFNNQTQVINEIKVEANTGGNKAEQGEVIEGEGRIEIHIKTIINGEEIEPIDIESSASEVRVESKIEVEQGKEPVIEREIEIGSPPIYTKFSNKIFQRWSGFVEGLKSILLGIFNIFK